MSVAADLRALLRDRLTVALDRALSGVLTLVLTRVLQELDQSLEDFEADSRRQLEPLTKVSSAGFQFPEPQIKQEPQRDSIFISEVAVPEAFQIKQEPTDRGRSLSDAEDAEKFNSIQIKSITSLSTVTSLNASQDPPPSSSKGPNPNFVTEECSEPLSVSAKDPLNPFALKVPVVKLHPLSPRTVSKNGKLLSKDKRTIPAQQKHKQRSRSKPKGVQYMCFCMKLFSEEELQTHLKSHDATDEPPGCPSSGAPLSGLNRSKKRSYSEAFNEKGGGQEVQTKGTQSCKESIIRYFRETSMNKSKANAAQTRKACEEEEAGSPIEEDAPLDTVVAGAVGAASVAGATGTPFSCDVCGRGFSWLPCLYKHRKTHFGRFPFWCPDCGRTFRRSWDLRAHLCVQTGERPYSCSICHETFFLRIQLHMHMGKHRASRKLALTQTEAGLDLDQTSTEPGPNLDQTSTEPGPNLDRTSTEPGPNTD